MGRSPCCDKASVKRGPWSPEEDDTLRTYIEMHGTGGNWIALPRKAGLKRCGKSCRLRWLNYLRPDIKHGGFTEEEDDLIFSLYSRLGSRWSVIAAQLPGRTDNDVKNHWNTKLKKRIMAASHSTLMTSAATAHTSPPPPPPQAAPPLFPISIPTIKTETYTCEDFMVPAVLTSTGVGAESFWFGSQEFTGQFLVSPPPTDDGSTSASTVTAEYGSSSGCMNWPASGPDHDLQQHCASLFPELRPTMAGSFDASEFFPGFYSAAATMDQIDCSKLH